MKYVFFMITIFFMITSCKNLFKTSIGRYYINHLYNGGTVSDTDFYTEVPFLLKDGQFYLPIKSPKTDKTYYFLFDTGAYSGIAKKNVSEFSGNYLDQNTSSRDVNGVKQSHSMFGADELSIGELSITNYSLSVDSYANEFIDGIIGIDFLSDKIILIDSEHQTISISSSIPELDPNQFSQFKIKQGWDKKLTLRIELPNNERERFIIDSGSNGFLRLNRDLGNVNILKQKRMNVAVEGAYSIEQKDITFIQQENLKILNLKIDTANYTVSSFYSANLIGNQILLHGQVLIDLIHNKIWLKDDMKVSKMGKDIPSEDVVLGWVSEHLIVARINPELKDYDIQLFDRIIEINDLMIPNKSDEAKKLVRSQMEKDEWVLKLERNESEIMVSLPKELFQN